MLFSTTDRTVPEQYLTGLDNGLEAGWPLYLHMDTTGLEVRAADRRAGEK